MVGTGGRKAVEWGSGFASRYAELEVLWDIQIVISRK